MAAGRPPVPPPPPFFPVTHEGHIDMTDMKKVETIVPTLHDDQIEIRNDDHYGNPVVDMTLTSEHVVMTPGEAVQTAKGLMRAVVAIGVPNPAEHPPVEVRTLPHDDLIFLGVKA